MGEGYRELAPIKGMVYEVWFPTVNITGFDIESRTVVFFYDKNLVNEFEIEFS